MAKKSTVDFIASRLRWQENLVAGIAISLCQHWIISSLPRNEKIYSRLLNTEPHYTAS
jgi:hypothetical protein